MLRWIVGSSLRFRYLVVAFAVGLMFFGVQQLRHTPVDVFPEFAPPKVEVQTPALGLSANQVESLVTIPLEQSLNGVPGLDEIRSKSVESLSSIEMIFKPGADLLTARQHVAERIAQIAPQLPTWASPPFMIQPLSATSRVVKIGLTPTDPDMDLIDLSMTTYWKIRTRLMRVPGVANVPIWGERIEMPTIEIDPERLRDRNVTVEEVSGAVADALDSGLLQYSDGNYIGRGGFVEAGLSRYQVRHILPIVDAADLANVPIESENGKQLRIGDVADLKRSTWPLVGDAVINDGPGLMLIVEKLPWANTLDVTRGVEEALAELEPALEGIAIDQTIFRPATFIEESISNLSKAILFGAILMILMLCLFLYEWRTALISVVAIPLSLIAAGLVLHWRGSTINTMILAGMVIALGDIVDDAIIDIENVVRRLRQRRAEGSQVSTARIILEASLEVRSAIVYATLIEIVAIAPIFLLDGLSGSFFRPLATSYALALLASMVVALTVTPALSLIFFRKPSSLQHRESPVVPALQRFYGFLLAKIVHRPRRAYVAVGLTTAMGLAALPLLGQSLLPSFKERDFLMHWLTVPGTGQPEMFRISAKANAELLEIPGVRNAGSHIGQAMHMDEVVGIDFGENWISVDPSVDYDETLAKVQEVVDGYPGIKRDVLTYLKERIREVLTGSSEAITIRIYGQDLAQLQETADEVNEILGSVPGVTENHVESLKDIPQVSVVVDLQAAQRVRAEARRRPPGGGPPARRRGGRRHLPGRQGVRRPGLEHARDARHLTRHREPAASTRRAASTCGSRTSPTSTIEPVPNVIYHDSLFTKPRRRRQHRWQSGPRVHRERGRVPSGRLRLAGGVPRRVPGRVHGATGRGRASERGRHRGGHRDLPAPAGLVRQLEARDVVLPDAADRPGRRCDRRVPDGRGHLARIARRVLHRARDRRPERDHADQPLPAPRAIRRRAVRSRARPAGRSRTRRADPHDRAHHRVGPDPAADRRRDPGPGDRVPDGLGDPRWADHGDPAEPVRGAVPLPALRQARRRRRRHDPDAGPGDPLTRRAGIRGRLG